MKEQTVIGRLYKEDILNLIRGKPALNDDLLSTLLGWLETTIKEKCALIISAPADDDPYKNPQRMFLD